MYYDNFAYAQPTWTAGIFSYGYYIMTLMNYYHWYDLRCDYNVMYAVQHSDVKPVSVLLS